MRELLCWSAIRTNALTGIRLNIMNCSSQFTRDDVELKDFIAFAMLLIRGLAISIERSALKQAPFLSISFEPRSTLQLWIVEPMMNTLHVGKGMIKTMLSTFHFFYLRFQSVLATRNGFAQCFSVHHAVAYHGITFSAHRHAQILSLHHRQKVPMLRRVLQTSVLVLQRQRTGSTFITK